MTRRFVTAAIALATAAMALPAAAQQSPAEVQELANRWTAAYNSVDVPALSDLYSDDAELYIHREGRFIGRASIGDYWAADMDRANPITVLNVTDSVVDNEMMLVHGNYQVLDRNTGVPLGGGRFAHIWVLEEDGWELDRDVWVDLQW
ncbi:YybH family protein [Alteraurantiacibacter aquimixticola]|nr:nuclear transport factor 2 family protein [Alteraurantiacibacter aquimixticola]